MHSRTRLSTLCLVAGICLFLVGFLVAGPALPAVHAGITPTVTPTPTDTPTPTNTATPTGTPTPETPTPESTPTSPTATPSPTETPVPQVIPESGGGSGLFSPLVLWGAGVFLLLVGVALRSKVAGQQS